MPGAVAALQGAEEDVRRSIAEYAARREVLVPLLNAIPGFRCQPPAGAFYAFPRVDACYRPGRAGSLELAAYLLDEAKVAVVPGIAFGDDAHIRLSFACSQEQLKEGIARIHEALR
jgi:aspartate aminotransferase